MIAVDWHRRVARSLDCGRSELRTAAAIFHSLEPGEIAVVMSIADLADRAGVSNAVASRTLVRLRMHGWLQDDWWSSREVGWEYADREIVLTMPAPRVPLFEQQGARA